LEQMLHEVALTQEKQLVKQLEQFMVALSAKVPLMQAG
jgi:hypothetical protein